MIDCGGIVAVGNCHYPCSPGIAQLLILARRILKWCIHHTVRYVSDSEPTPPFKQVRPWPHHFLRLSVFFFLNVTGKDYGLRA